MKSNTLIDFIKWAEKLFLKNNLYFGHGTLNAKDEAAWIASHILKINLTEADPNKILTKNQIYKLQKIVLLRAKHKQPLSYLIKTAWFAEKKYYVDPRVIIPRSPFAELINNKFNPWLLKKPLRILDLCTGSGCMAIACYHAFIKQNPLLKIDAVDLCSDALKVANRNLTLHNKEYKYLNYDIFNHVSLIKSNLFNNIPVDQDHKYDLIISNPPYVDQKTFNNLPKEFYFEPKKALLSGKTGFELVNKILKVANKYLNNNGILIIEVGCNWKKLPKLFPKIKFLWLELKCGGEGIFLLTKKQLDDFVK